MQYLRDLLIRWHGLAHPLRAMPRWAALLLLAIFAATGAWSMSAVASFKAQQDQVDAKRPKDDFGDMDLYGKIADRVGQGENYYAVALDEHRQHKYPAYPFVTVRTPIMAWGVEWFGRPGWRIVAIVMMLANVVVWAVALRKRVSLVECAAVGMLIAVFGIVSFYKDVGLIHDYVSGLFASLAIGLCGWRRGWIAGLIVGAMAIAIRELTIPLMLLWGVVSGLERRWREFAGVMAVTALLGIAMALHAQGVMAHRLPSDLSSPGWGGEGLKLVLTSLTQLSALMIVPAGWGGVLALLPLLGWLALGGRIGVFASLWFLGMILMISLFARANNFYWVVLLLPAYLAGIALVPRALYDLAHAIRANS